MSFSSEKSVIIDDQVPYSSTSDVFFCSDSEDSAIKYMLADFSHDKFAVSVFEISNALSIDHADFEAMNNNLKISSVWNVDFVWFLCHS